MLKPNNESARDYKDRDKEAGIAPTKVRVPDTKSGVTVAEVKNEIDVYYSELTYEIHGELLEL